MSPLVPGRTAVALAALIASLAAAVTGAAQPVRSVAMPFFDVEELRVSGDLAVGLYSSLTEQQTLVVTSLQTGTELARVHDVGRAAFDVVERRVLYASRSDGRVFQLDVDTQSSTPVWDVPRGKTVAAIRASQASTILVAESAASVQAVVLDHGGAVHVSDLLTPTAPWRQLVSSTTVLVWGPGGAAYWSVRQRAWRTIELGDRYRLLALMGDRLTGVEESSGRVMQRRLGDTDAAEAWAEVHRVPPGAALAFAGPEPDDTGLVLAERRGGTVSITPVNAGTRTGPTMASVPPTARILGWSGGALVWAQRRDGRLWLSTAGAAADRSPVASTSPSRTAPAAADAVLSGRLALEWLRGQLGRSFTSRYGRSAVVIDSYEDRERAGWIYDAAVAAIAFTAAGEPEVAATLLAGLEHLQETDGSWVSSYDPDAITPRGTDRYVGAIAWVVLAVNFFEADTRDTTFASAARRALRYLERFRIVDPASSLDGAFTMGPVRPGVVSTEHNVDCYAAFLWRGRLDDEPHELGIADASRAFLLRQITARGIDDYFRVGPREPGVYLDVQTWTTLALAGGTLDEQLRRVLRFAERVLGVQTRVSGISTVRGLDDTERPRGSAKIWTEGTEGMVAALFAVGEPERAGQYHGQMRSLQGPSGGIPYATANDHGWSTAPSVASTAWHVLNSLNPPRNPFQPHVY
jgi:hypothetical protein